MVNNITVSHDGTEYRYVTSDGASKWLSESDEAASSNISSKLVTIAVQSGIDSGIFSASTPAQGSGATAKPKKIKIFDN
tara:strand:+ start:3203 stop:3439 length:237 start_codon:yes stop_codon:yes gene_type:complete